MAASLESNGSARFTILLSPALTLPVPLVLNSKSTLAIEPVVEIVLPSKLIPKLPLDVANDVSVPTEVKLDATTELPKLVLSIIF